MGVEVPAAFSFRGAFLTGAAAVSVAVVAVVAVVEVVAGFLTGVGFEAVDVVFLVGVAIVFFAAGPARWATFDKFPTLATIYVR